MFVVPTESSPG